MRLLKIAGITTLLFVGFLIVVLVAGDPQDTGSTAEPAQATSEPPSNATRAQVFVQLIKKNLRNPDSFRADTILVTEAGAVCATYRAEDAMGGMSREQAVWSADQKQTLGSSDAGFDALWNAECAGKTGVDTAAIFQR